MGGVGGLRPRPRRFCACHCCAPGPPARIAAAHHRRGAPSPAARWPCLRCSVDASPALRPACSLPQSSKPWRWHTSLARAARRRDWLAPAPAKAAGIRLGRPPCLPLLLRTTCDAPKPMLAIPPTASRAPADRCCLLLDKARCAAAVNHGSNVWSNIHSCQSTATSKGCGTCAHALAGKQFGPEGTRAAGFWP